ncbi:MAG: BON domain-containing protein [Gammaproteobacteria bacterium]|nr:BON domain-containing protein [Gammaproteobacteria bacterium]
MGKSRVLDLPVPAARISIADPSIADILSINERQIYINGKQLGTTNMILWDRADRVQRQVGLEVTHDLQTLKQKLHQLLPKEGIEVSSAKGAIVLSGEVSSPSRLDAALELAKGFAGNENSVINLLQVGGAQQVLLEVKVAEVSRSFGKQIGVDLLGLYDGGDIEIGLLRNAETGTLIPNLDFDLGASTALDLPSTGAALKLLSGNFAGTSVALDIAQSQGLARILAEPNLTTLSGQQAEFLSGGEFPVPIFEPSEDGGGTTVIVFKTFGIELKFLPVVLGNDLISLKVNVSVSELSDEAGVIVGASNVSSVTAVPSLRTRGADSTVEVPSGQTIAIAGLLSESARSIGDRYPGLGDLPVLGTLFRSQQFEKNQTELVIFVTPRLARSYDAELVKLPTDDFVDPSDVEFYLQGRLFSRPGRNEAGAAPRPGGGRLGPDKSGSEGPFGHDL